MIPCHLSNEALLEEIRNTPVSPERFDAWWLGQSGFLIHWNGHFLLLDPYLSDSLTRKYATTDKPHTRMTSLVVPPHSLDMVRVVTSSHNHTDHLDAETLVPLALACPGLALILPSANERFARERLSAVGNRMPSFHGLDDGTTLVIGPWEFHGIAAAHNAVARDAEGRCLYLGYVIRFGAFAIYHSGDTLWHSGLAPALIPHAVDLAFLPINGNRPERRVSGNLNGTEAAALGKVIGARLTVPCHYHQFVFNTEEPDEFIHACARMGTPHRVLRCGERVTVAQASATD